jgi:hypothetical protein
MHAKAKYQGALRNFSLFRSNRHAKLISSSNFGIPRYALGCITLGGAGTARRLLTKIEYKPAAFLNENRRISTRRLV